MQGRQPSQCATCAPLTSYSRTGAAATLFRWQNHGMILAWYLWSMFYWSHTSHAFCWPTKPMAWRDPMSNTVFRSRSSQKPESALTSRGAGLNAQGGPQKRENTELLIFTQEDFKENHITLVNSSCSALHFGVNLLSFSLLIGTHTV